LSTREKTPGFLGLSGLAYSWGELEKYLILIKDAGNKPVQCDYPVIPLSLKPGGSPNPRCGLQGKHCIG